MYHGLVFRVFRLLFLAFLWFIWAFFVLSFISYLLLPANYKAMVPIVVPIANISIVISWVVFRIIRRRKH